MKRIILIFLTASLIACDSESDTDTTKGNTDTTIDSIAVEKDHTINRDTSIRIDSGMKDTSR